MERYTLYCTQEQTKKAFELGAPIEFELEYPINLRTLERSTYPDIKMGKDGEPILIAPTAEQMLGWLEEQLKGVISLDKGFFNGRREWIWTISDDYENIIDTNIVFYPTRQEATIAAIDAALDYLIKIKEE